MTETAEITHLVFTTFAGRRWSGSYHVAEGRVHVRSIQGRMSARLTGDARKAAEGVLEVIAAMYLSTLPLEEGGVAGLGKLH